MAQGEEMKKTLNAERRTPNVEGRVSEFLLIGRWTFGVGRFL
jgi:hypothetical protein